MNQNTNTAKITAAALSDAEFAWLLGQSGIQQSDNSPAAEALKRGASGNGDHAMNLQQLGLLSSIRPVTLSPECMEAISILGKPDAETTLLWGNPEKINSASFFSTRETGPTMRVAYTRGLDKINHLSYFISDETIVGVVNNTLDFTELKEAPDLSIRISPRALPVFFALLDIFQEERLRAALDRRTGLHPDFSPSELKRVIINGQMEPSLSWYAALGSIITNSTRIANEASLEQGLGELRRAGIILGTGDKTVFSPGLTTFANRAFPITGYCVIKTAGDKGTHIETQQAAFIRGMTAMLFIHTADETGTTLQLESIISSDVVPPLCEILSLPFESLPQRPSVSAKLTDGNTCPKCGTNNPAGVKFCSNCGADLTPKPKISYCPKCGDLVKANEKFCNKCGNRIS
jgi:hypothetical protein